MAYVKKIVTLIYFFGAVCTFVLWRSGFFSGQESQFDKRLRYIEAYNEQRKIDPFAKPAERMPVTSLDNQHAFSKDLAPEKSTYGSSYTPEQMRLMSSSKSAEIVEDVFFEKGYEPYKEPMMSSSKSMIMIQKEDISPIKGSYFTPYRGKPNTEDE
jgi:hypothetical protein